MGRDPSGIGHFLSPGEACEIMIGPLQPSLDSKARPYTDKNWTSGAPHGTGAPGR